MIVDDGFGALMDRRGWLVVHGQEFSERTSKMFLDGISYESKDDEKGENEAERFVPGVRSVGELFEDA